MVGRRFSSDKASPQQHPTRALSYVTPYLTPTCELRTPYLSLLAMLTVGGCREWRALLAGGGAHGPGAPSVQHGQDLPERGHAAHSQGDGLAGGRPGTTHLAAP